MGRNDFSDSLDTTIMGRYPRPGTLLLGKYLVEGLIGEGGMGVVIKAKHIDLDEFVAIKCLLPEMMERKEIVLRFLREAKAAVKLKGEHVARVHDVGRFPETQVPYIVMEYLEGADLNAIIKHHGSQDPSIATDLILQGCEAIAEAHSLGIIHRDIKASNFFITQPQNQAPILKVLDFGIATAPEGTSDLTSTQSVIGTPSYMAPEQMRSSRTADQRSDIWSIGVVLYELVEGARPFRSDVYSELCLKVGMDPPMPMENPDVPEGLRAVVLKCLEKPMEKRYQNVAELAFDLMPFASDQVAARAAVEQCARLLGRRGSKMHDAAELTERDDSPSGSKKPKSVPRITPPNEIAVPRSPISSSQPSLSSYPTPVATVLGRPTPMPSSQPKTPTSIKASSGELSKSASAVYPALKPRRSGLVVAFTAITVLALVGGGAYLASSKGWFGGDKGLEPQSNPMPSLPPEPPKVDPIEPKATDTKPETVKPTDPTDKPANAGDKPSAGDKPPVTTGDKPPVTTGDKPPVNAGDKPPVNAGDKPPVNAGDKPPVNVGTKPPVNAGTKPPVNVGAKPPVNVGQRPPVNVGTKPPIKKDPPVGSGSGSAGPGGDLYNRRR